MHRLVLKLYAEELYFRMVMMNHSRRACIYMEDYLSIDYLDNIKECQCKKVTNPFCVDGAVAEEVE